MPRSEPLGRIVDESEPSSHSLGEPGILANATKSIANHVRVSGGLPETTITPQCISHPTPR